MQNDLVEAAVTKERERCLAILESHKDILLDKGLDSVFVRMTNMIRNGVDVVNDHTGDPFDDISFGRR